MSLLRLIASYDTAAAFLDAYEAEVSAGGLLVRGTGLTSPGGLDACVVEVRVAGHPPVEVPARVASARGRTVAVVFEGGAGPLDGLARALRGGPAAAAASPPGSPPGTAEEEPRGTMAERIAALSLGQKIQLALSGDREARVVLLRDINKNLHAFVLRNVRIGLDEVQFAARLPGLAPEALEAIAKNATWIANAGICAALVRNPATPMAVAVALVPSLPAHELRAIARGGARPPLVQAARRLLAGA